MRNGGTSLASARIPNLGPLSKRSSTDCPPRNQEFWSDPRHPGTVIPFVARYGEACMVVLRFFPPRHSLRERRPRERFAWKNAMAGGSSSSNVWLYTVCHMAGTTAIVAVLGGRKSFQGKVSTWQELHRSIEHGLRYSALDALDQRYSLSSDEIVFLLAVPSRTLARRKIEDRFRPEESDRIVRLGRIGALAEQILGGATRAARWLRRENRALAGETPLRQLDTDIGTQQVENVLLRIAHGVYS